MSRQGGPESAVIETEYNNENVKPNNMKEKLKNMKKDLAKKIKKDDAKTKKVLENSSNVDNSKQKSRRGMFGRAGNRPLLTDKNPLSNNTNTGDSSLSGPIPTPTKSLPRTPRTPNDNNNNNNNRNSSTGSHNNSNGNNEHTTPTSYSATPTPPTHNTRSPQRNSSLPVNRSSTNKNENTTSPSVLANSSVSHTQPNTPHLDNNNPTQSPQRLDDNENEAKARESEYLKFCDGMLSQIHDFEETQTNTREEIARIRSEINQLQRKKDENSNMIKELQVELYDLLKQVKVTDDDLSTIQKKLAALSGKLSNFPPNSKKSFNKKEPVKSKTEIIAFFNNCWTEELGYSSGERDNTAKNVEGLFQNNSEIDYALVSVLVEKLIIDHFVRYIFEAPIYMDFTDINVAYQTIESLFNDANHPEWNSNLRLRCVKATLTDIERDSKVAEKSKDSRTILCEKLLKKLSVIYDVNEITPRIKKLVEMASDLSFPMNSQEERIEIRRLQPYDPFYTKQVKAQYGSDKSPNKVKLGISPVFLIKNSIHLDEDDEDNMEENDNMSFDPDDYDEDDEGSEEKERPNLGSYADHDHTLVYTGRAIGYNEESKQDEQTKTEI